MKLQDLKKGSIYKLVNLFENNDCSFIKVKLIKKNELFANFSSMSGKFAFKLNEIECLNHVK